LLDKSSTNSSEELDEGATVGVLYNEALEWDILGGALQMHRKTKNEGYFKEFPKKKFKNFQGSYFLVIGILVSTQR